MSTSVGSRLDYLERLRDHLPSRDVARVLEEVDGLIQDRIDAELEHGGVDERGAEQRALDALGAPEVLAAQLVDAPLTIDLATRRTFRRVLAILFAAHLVLSIVLTAAGSQGAAIPGLLGPLPTHSLAAVFGGVLSILLIDTGAMFLFFALLGRGKAPSALPQLQLRTAASRRDAALGLLLLVLVALILHPFRDQIFAVRDGDRLVGFLAQDLVAVLPFVDLALVLFALRQLLILWKGRESTLAVGADALASLVLAGSLIYAATRSVLVSFPSGSLGQSAADTLEDVVTRVFLLVFVAAALFLAVRFVKRVLRVRQLLAT